MRKNEKVVLQIAVDGKFRRNRAPQRVSQSGYNLDQDRISRRCPIFWAVIARVVAFLFLFALLVPHPAPAGIVLDASSPAIMTSFESTGTQPSGPANYDLAKHIGCS